VGQTIGFRRLPCAGQKPKKKTVRTIGVCGEAALCSHLSPLMMSGKLRPSAHHERERRRGRDARQVEAYANALFPWARSVSTP